MSLSTPPQRLEEAAVWCARLADRASTRDDAAFLAWLASTPENREAFEALCTTLDDVEYYAGAPEMLKLRAAALTEARRSHEVSRPPVVFSRRFSWAIAVVLTVIATATGTWYLKRPNGFETRIGERRALTLPDGSQLSLDAATQVKLDYGPDRRRVVLARGRAKFDVAKDALRPFTVEAGSKVVVATGTSFSVELVGREVRVTLYQGHVEVISASAATEHPPDDAYIGRAADITLNPGQELVASTTQTSAPAQVSTVDASRSLSWEGGDLAFADEPLSIAVARVNRYLDRPLKVGDDQASNVHISGVFHAGDMEAFVDGVTALFPVRAQRDKDGTTLVFAPHPGH